MRKIHLLLVIIAIGFISASVFNSSQIKADSELIPYPEGYRNWTHVKTGFVGPTNPGFKLTGGFHHIYANDKAMQGYQTGKFPEGSILVFDVINFQETNGNLVETDRFHLDVMVKDSVKFKSNGGWGYEEFEKDSRTQRNLTAITQTQCANCHSKQADHVFSEYRK